MIKLKGIRKDFRLENLITRALNDIDISVEKGDFLSVMGPSGCGKSTLLNILGMLDSPTEGQYIFNGIDVVNTSKRQLAKIRNKNLGFIFQSFNLIDDLTVFENIELPLIYQGMEKKERTQKVNSVMERVDISARESHFPNQLSGGQQQRVAVARAVVVEPKLVLADEPTGNLDSKNGKQVMDLLASLNAEGATIVMVTHSSEDAMYGNRIVNLFDGKIVENKSQRRSEKANTSDVTVGDNCTEKGSSYV